jgi:hypothetical protein
MPAIRVAAIPAFQVVSRGEHHIRTVEVEIFGRKLTGLRGLLRLLNQWIFRGH